MNYTINNPKPTPSWFIAIWVAILIILLAFKAFGQKQYTHRKYENKQIIEFTATVKDIRELTKTFVNKKDIPPLDTTGLPVMNKKVLYFIDSVLGKRVGDGICWELTAEAFKYAGAWVEVNKKHWSNLFSKKRFVRQEGLIMQRQVKPGDMIDFYGHMALIYRKLNDFDFLIAHQSARMSKEVVISFHCSDCIASPHGIQLYFYRPIP